MRHYIKTRRRVKKQDPVADHYYVENYGYWFVVRCSSEKIARKWGTQEFGFPRDINVRAATRDEVNAYIVSKNTAILPLEDDPS